MSRALRGLVVLSSFIRIAFCQGISTVTVSKNPVYDGEPVTLTCSIAVNDAVLMSVTMDAFNETRNVGTLFCISAIGEDFRNTGASLFSGYNFTGCQTGGGVMHQSVSISASQSWELDYTCTFEILFRSTRIIQNVTSASTRLSVWVLPETPSLNPGLLVFNEGDNATISCNSRLGKPAAAINLTVLQPFGSHYVQRSGTDSVSLTLPIPLSDWHGAVATCNVTNHIIRGAISRTININYIAARHDEPLEIDTYVSSQTLNCSAEVSSFPGVSYNWSIPPEMKSSESSSSLSSPVLAVPQGRTGLFECIATNNVTLKAVRITFAVSSIMGLRPWQGPAVNNWIWAVVATGAAVIIIIIVLIVLYRLGRLPKVCKSSCLTPASRHQSEGSNNRGQITTFNEYLSRAEDVKTPSGENDVRMGQPSRLLIAAEGVVGDLKHMILPTITLVEYPDRSCSLDGILDKVGQAISISSSPAFVSVALLLRRSRIGLILSETDQAVLTSESWAGAQGDKVRGFVTRLAEMSLDKRAGHNRIDLLNYGSKDAASLCLAMTHQLKIPVTVSKDRFGMEKSANRNEEHYCVGEDYFSRASQSKVVYADVELNNGQVSPRFRKADDQVVYSELVRKS